MSNRNSLPVCNIEGYHYFCPLQGDGEFGELSLVKVTGSQQKLQIQYIRKATYRERCKLCDAHEHHMFWYTLISIPKKQGVSGALLWGRQYPEGMAGKIPVYPKQEVGKSGGNLV